MKISRTKISRPSTVRSVREKKALRREEFEDEEEDEVTSFDDSDTDSDSDTIETEAPVDMVGDVIIYNDNEHEVVEDLGDSVVIEIDNEPVEVAKADVEEVLEVEVVEITEPTKIGDIIAMPGDQVEIRSESYVSRQRRIESRLKKQSRVESAKKPVRKTIKPISRSR